MSEKDAFETTGFENEKYRTHKAKYFYGEPGEFKNGKDAFNTLCPLPQTPISLDEERCLNITHWAPVADEDTIGFGVVRVRVEGFIELKKHSSRWKHTSS